MRGEKEMRKLWGVLGGLLLELLICTPVTAEEVWSEEAATLNFNGQAPAQKSGTKPCATPVSELGFKNLWCDQKAMWGAALHPERHWRLVVPFAAATGVLIATDKYVARSIAGDPPGSFYHFTKQTSNLGLAEVTYGTMGSLYLAGLLTRSKYTRETAMLIAEAYVDSEVVKQLLKYGTRRERPADVHGNLLDNGRGRFWFGGISFPAGHVMNFWPMATVFSNRYPDKPVIKYTAYGLAALVSVSRIGARAHFSSDVLVGSVLGYLIGKFVVRAHSSP
jgi:membrane-associated phospholipid phosphatase